MATIDKLDVGIYINYARRTEYIEQIHKQFHLEEASSVPPQTLVTDLYPKLSELDLLLGVSRTYAAWALFYPPKKFNLRRKSPFTFSKVTPSVISDDEEQDLELFEKVATKDQKEEKEKETLKECIKQVHKINEWLGQIIGRMGQLLQG